ncbi:hypothetical protein K1T71_012401 [Dendrolimus kikuchii]|uniref:Uncharacterized protein n=1 Tax=Dendrolimus kikuchii TaxID=765133 RepID=A0ACC1CLH5_9NEOP|nr:hypothetical protein K1T71_012401 [Dendrolimus kikuchii]
MTLYEGIALIQEKQAVVLDLGSEYTKFGFTGEAAPRCIIRSEFWCTTERKYKKVYDYKTPEELYDNLVHMLHLLYFRHVLVNPKERKVVVVESLFTPTLFRETLAKVLFTHYEVSGVVWADSPRLCALTLGAPVALVVAVGGREAEVAAVVHSCVVLHAMQTQPLAARAIHASLAELLDEDNNTKLNLPDHIIEDIKVKTCFVVGRERAARWRSPSWPAAACDVAYPVAGRSAIAVAGRTRELAAEVLFARDAELASLPDIVLQCIMQCPIDARRELAANILVTGGTATLPGLKARLAEELRYLITQPPYESRLHVREFRFHRAPCPENACAWAGGAVCGAADGGAARATPRDAYARARRLPDWVCLLDNTPPHHPHRDNLDI